MGGATEEGAWSGRSGPIRSRAELPKLLQHNKDDFFCLGALWSVHTPSVGRTSWHGNPGQTGDDFCLGDTITGGSGDLKEKNFPLIIIMIKVLFPKDQSPFQTSAGLGWAHLPTNLFFPQARLTGLFGQAPPLHHSDFHRTCACLPRPARTWQSGTAWAREGR